MKDLNERYCKPIIIGEVIKDYFAENYKVPESEIKYWIENGWTFNESEMIMQRKGRESVRVKSNNQL